MEETEEEDKNHGNQDNKTEELIFEVDIVVYVSNMWPIMGPGCG